eukprot:1029068-Ditylum_brightwellii.AAC.1
MPQKEVVKLKRQGKVVTAQSKALEHSQICSPRQYQWHMTTGSVWVNVRIKNKPAALFQMLHYRAKHNLNLAEDRSSMTVLRSGSTAGINGPLIFVTKGSE